MLWCKFGDFRKNFTISWFTAVYVNKHCSVLLEQTNAQRIETQVGSDQKKTYRNLRLS
jgi:hypothetical protein